MRIALRPQSDYDNRK